MKTLVLDGTTISLQVAMSTSAATTNPTFVASYADNSGTGITEGATDGVLNGSTDVTLVGAPTGANRRVIKDITIFNGDTAAVTVIIKYDNNATQRTLVRVTLAVGDTYTTDGTFDTNGYLKQISTSGGDVVGPASATSNNLVAFDGTTGKLIKQANTVTAAQGGTGVSNNAASTLTISGNFGTTLTVSGTTGVTLPTTGTLSTLAGTETLTNKTLTTPVISSISNTGTLTLPTSTDTLVGRATTDTLTNKTLTSPIFTAPVLGTPSSGTLSSCTVDGTDAVGFRNIPQNSQSAAYTLVLADAGKHIFHPSGDANARTYTIPANSSVAYPIGTAITFINMTSQVVTIAITTDTMYLSSAGTTGSRSLAQYGSATAIKITSTNWLISGSGLT